MEWRRRVLLINVFFWPDAVGGATRVVMDQCRQLVAEGNEVTVLCSAKRSRGDYRVEVNHWEGCRVIRLHCPLKPWHIHRDGGAQRFMDSWLRRERFDLVHAHSIQVLSADILSPCLAHGLPVFVSLHDGWWLGRHLFLTTFTGRSIIPGNWLDDLDLPDHQSDQLLGECTSLDGQTMEALKQIWNVVGMEGPRGNEINLDSDQLLRWPEAAEPLKKLSSLIPDGEIRGLVLLAFVRHLDLFQLLARLDHRYAVSASFADLYRKAGVADVEVKENESRPVEIRSRLRAPDEIGLVFGFFGGWSLHKGVGVLEEACRLYNGPRCSLLAVHEAGRINPSIAFDWGLVRVKLIAPVLLDEIADLYARIDVLIAPSIWPESYGLVSREAISAGKKVIASAIGALAEPILDDSLGYKVEPGQAADLAVAMERCQDDLACPESSPA